MTSGVVRGCVEWSWRVRRVARSTSSTGYCSGRTRLLSLHTSFWGGFKSDYKSQQKYAQIFFFFLCYITQERLRFFWIFFLKEVYPGGCASFQKNILKKCRCITQEIFFLNNITKNMNIFWSSLHTGYFVLVGDMPSFE